MANTPSGYIQGRTHMIGGGVWQVWRGVAGGEGCGRCGGVLQVRRE